MCELNKKVVPSYPLFDSHCHISLLCQKDPNYLNLYRQLFQAKKLAKVWDIGIDHDDYPYRKTLLEGLEGVFFSIGLHPNQVSKQNINWDNWSKWVKDDRVILIGEMGLDFSKDKYNEKIQKESFISQIEFANFVKKPITVHIRSADEAFLSVLQQKPPLYGGIWHCFSSNYEMASKVLEFGFKISFSGNITYAKSDSILECLEKIPLDSILIETDSPFLAPQPLRGQVNYSANLVYILQKVSQIRNKDPYVMAERILENGQNFIESGVKIGKS